MRGVSNNFKKSAYYGKKTGNLKRREAKRMKRVLLVILCLTLIVAGGAYVYLNERETIDYSNEMFVDRSDVVNGYASMYPVCEVI